MSSRLYVATDASPVDSATHNLCSDYLQTLNSFGPLYKYVFIDRSTTKLLHYLCRSVTDSPARHRRPAIEVASEPSIPSTSPAGSASPSCNVSVGKDSKRLTYPAASTSLSPGASGTTLTFHVITPQLALLALLPTTVYETRRGLVEYNVVFFREGVQEIWQVEKEARTAISSS